MIMAAFPVTRLKQRMRRSTISLAVICLALILGWSCEKEDLDPDYPFTVSVKTFQDSIPAQNIRIEVIAVTEGGKPEVFFTKFSNEAGRASFTYDKNANFIIRATRGFNPYTYMGCTEIQLEPNEEILKTVYLEPYDEEVQGCEGVQNL